VRVVEVDVSKRAHEEWHIDGAVLWDVYRDLKDARGCGPATSRQRSTSPSTACTTSARSATPPPCATSSPPPTSTARTS